MNNVENNTEYELLDLLKQDGYVNEDNTLNVLNLMGKNMQTGKGSLADGDVYVLERRQETASSVMVDSNNNLLNFYLIYYDTNKEDTNLGLAFENQEKNEKKYRLEAKYFYQEDGSNHYESPFAFIDTNNNLVEFGERAVVIQDEITYYDGNALDYISNNILELDKIYYNTYWDKSKPITLIVYKENEPYTLNGYVYWPA